MGLVDEHTSYERIRPDALALEKDLDGARRQPYLVQDDPGFPTAYRVLAACYAHMGRLDEARAIVAKLRTVTPHIVPSDMPWRNLEDRELLLSGLASRDG